jgi:homoserine O-acetyltransferase
MQALQWAISYPSRLRHAVLIATAPSLSALNIAFNEVSRQAILTDPDFREGRYEDPDCPRHGLRLARMLAHINYSSGAGLERKFGRALRHAHLDYTFEPIFEIEAYLHHQARKFADHFDADYYLRITKALDHFDPARDHGAGELWRALQRTTADFLVIAFSTDWRFAPSRSKEIVDALHRTGKHAVYHEVSGPYGHDGFLMDDAHYHGFMRARFEAIAGECMPRGGSGHHGTIGATACASACE